MAYVKDYSNGFRLVVNKMEGLYSVCVGVMVKTGSANENREENGISHFIEHCLFKGTDKRTAFQISDDIDCIGAQINAYTAKETTCYHTKSTAEHLEETMEILSDLFFNSALNPDEIEKEKGVVIEEIKMSEDDPEDVCFDLLAQSKYGSKGIGRTILGPERNIKEFTREDILDYMSKYYTPDNVVLSVSGKLDEEEVEKLAEKYFVKNFSSCKSAKQIRSYPEKFSHLHKNKKIEQTHIGLSLPTFDVLDERNDLLSIANFIFGGSMSSRLFQKIREELGLCYTIYSYGSAYKDSGVLEIYAGVNTELRDKAVDAIIKEIDEIRNGITKKEFSRAKEKMNSSFIMSQENTFSQMTLYAKYLLLDNELYNFEEKIQKLNKIKIDDVNEVLHQFFVSSRLSSAVVGPIKKPLF